MKIFSVGHSTHSIEIFISMLKSFKIELLVDIRSYPGSNYVPQFNQEIIKIWLEENNINYLHIPQLGGMRRKNLIIDNDLINGWKNISFKNYSAYSLTEEYKKGLDKLIELSKTKQICFMCSESVPWKCHRLLVSNSLSVKGFDVYHIMNESKILKHELNKYGAKAELYQGKLIYPKTSMKNNTGYNKNISEI